MGIASEARIERELHGALKEFLSSVVHGGFYKNGERPFNSREEDAVLSIASASPDQIQEGRARLNIFIPDVYNEAGLPEPYKDRIEEVSELSEAIIGVLNGSFYEYDFKLERSASVTQCSNIQQHAVTIEISFKRLTF